jgi:hypothetical protein
MHGKAPRSFQLLPHFTPMFELEVAEPGVKGYLPGRNWQGVDRYAGKGQIDKIPYALN